MQPVARQRTILLPRRAVGTFLAFLVVAFLGLPALADHIGPHRTVSSFVWERLACHYEAVYDPPGPGFFGCTLDLYEPPDGSCPSEGSVAGFFNPGVCSGWPGSCGSLPCRIFLDDSTESCSEGQQGCRSVEKAVNLPPAAVSGSVSCSVSGSGGWCRGGAELSVSGSEPLTGYSILTLEGTRSGEPFACTGAACGVPLLEGNNAFTFWARSSYGDTSSAGSAGGKLDSIAPAIVGDLSGTSGDGGWFVSEVTITTIGTDPAPGSGLASLEVSVDGSGWSTYFGPLVISDGDHNVDLRAFDGAENTSQASLAVWVDTLPPEVVLSAGASFCPGCGQALDIEVTVQDSGSGIVEWTHTAGGVMVASGSGPGSQSLAWDGSGLGGGSHTLTLEARDAAGNTSAASDSFELIVPTPPPESPAEDTSSESVQKSASASTTATVSAGPTPTAIPRPTRTPLTIPFGVLPAAPQPSTGEEPPPSPPLGSSSGESSSTASSSSSVPVFGAAALALIAAASVFTLDRLRRRQEEEAALRQEMERRNAAARAREDAERVALAAAATGAALAAIALDSRDQDDLMSRIDDGIPMSDKPTESALGEVDPHRSATEREGDPARLAERQRLENWRLMTASGSQPGTSTLRQATGAVQAASSTPTPTPQPMPVPTPPVTSTPVPSSSISDKQFSESYPPEGFEDPLLDRRLIALGASGSARFPSGSLGPLIEWGKTYSVESPEVGDTVTSQTISMSGEPGRQAEIGEYHTVNLGPVSLRLERTLIWPRLAIEWRPPGVLASPAEGIVYEFTRSVTVNIEGAWWNQFAEVEYNLLDYRATASWNPEYDVAYSGTAGDYFKVRPLQVATTVVLVAGAALATWYLAGAVGPVGALELLRRALTAGE